MKIPHIVFVSVLLFVLAGSAPLLRAQDQTRSVQEELRRRSLYFGNVDGRDSAELQEATKRYQRRKGFEASGQADPTTLRSLGLIARGPNEPPPKELDWPAEPVLPSDEKLDAVALADSLSEETGIAPVSVVSEKVAKERGLTTKSRRKGSSAAPVIDETQVRAADSPFMTAEEIARFAKEYFRSRGSNDLKRQLRLYADKVDYYSNGKIDRRLIEQTLRRYHTRWPRRTYRIGDLTNYARVPDRGEIIITFPVTFTLRDGTRTVKGETENRLVISAATVDPRIVSISERRVRR
ncbi:MAG: peptidoglycan-binding domain-containing protein [Chthoniobacterales bacterium]